MKTIFKSISLMLAGWAGLFPFTVGQAFSAEYSGDTVLLDELKANFKEWYRDRDRVSPAPSGRITDDAPWAREIRYYDGDIGRKVHYAETPEPDRLYRTRRHRLPAACWSIDHCYTFTGRQQRLYLHSLLPGELSATDSTALCRKLEQGYGHITEKGIPATWFSGTLGVAANWFPYCNNRVTMSVLRYRIEKGMVIGREAVKNRFGTLAQRQKETLIPTLDQIYRYWDMYLGDMELRYFSEALQAVLPPAEGVYHGQRRFSFLLLTDSRGRTALHRLLPERLTAEEKACTDRLAQAVRALPAGLFGYMVTTDGRIFPARYLEGTYHPDENYWTFSDYFFSNKRVYSRNQCGLADNRQNYSFSPSPWFREEQPDTVSEEEARCRFIAWLRSGKTGLGSSHQVLTHRSGEILLRENPIVSRYIYNLASLKPELLETAGRISLPQGQWTLCGHYTSKGKEVELCWHGSGQPHTAGGYGTPLYQQLARSYGEYPGFGVPARWYSGTFGLSTSHRAYGGFNVCPFVRIYRVEKGKVAHSQLLRSCFILGSRYDGIYDVKCWDELTIREMDWLACLLQGVLSAPVYEERDWSFSFMVYGGAGKRLRASLLGNPPTGAFRQSQANVLLRAVENLRVDFFGALVTQEGRILPARYIKASYHARDKKWTFRDYLHTDNSPTTGLQNKIP